MGRCDCLLVYVVIYVCVHKLNCKQSYVTIIFPINVFLNQIKIMYSLRFSLHRPQLEILCAHLF
jgi:hypothetical protein